MEHSRDPERQTGDEAREQRIKQLILAAVGRCGECRRRYRLDDLAVIGHRDHLWMVTVICEHCHSQGFITAIVGGLVGRPSAVVMDTRETIPAGPRMAA